MIARFLIIAIASASLFAQDVSPKPRAVSMIQTQHHSHKKLWVSIAAIAGAAIATGLIESREGSVKPLVPAVSDCRHLGHLITCVGL